MSPPGPIKMTLKHIYIQHIHITHSNTTHTHTPLVYNIHLQSPHIPQTHKRYTCCTHPHIHTTHTHHEHRVHTYTHLSLLLQGLYRAEGSCASFEDVIQFPGPAATSPGPSSAVATSLERHEGEFQICIFCLRKRVWSCFFFFFPLPDCQITHLPRPRDYFSKQRYRWGWLFFLKFHMALMSATCVTVNRHFSPSSQHHKREAQTVRAGSLIRECRFCPESLKLYWMLGAPGAQAIHTYYQDPTRRDSNS